VAVNARIGKMIVGDGGKPLLIAGPCVIESESLTLSIAETIATLPITKEFHFVFKASFTKDNRSAGDSFRGPGIEEGLRILEKARASVGCPILSDVHSEDDVAACAPVLDVLQIPAFLCRQTSLIEAAGASGKPVNIKKGQFLAPDDVRHAVAKVVDAGNPRVFVTERGTSFGYHNLVVDMRAFPMIREMGVPVVFDVTHSLQLPGGGDGVTSGQAEYIEPLASAGVGAGVDGVFLEVHDEPRLAKSDAQNALRLDALEPLLRKLTAIDAIVKQAGIATRVHG
jgi:2-dehydro-3-deoxyphosphooctonate aldolase (KDO 8-P synthase)